MTQGIPLNPVPNQTLQIVLAGQNCQITVYTAPNGLLFIDIEQNDAPVRVGVIAENLNKIIKYLYFGFSGDFVFVDTQPDPINGASDPLYAGLGTRFLLLYLTAAEANNQ